MNNRLLFTAIPNAIFDAYNFAEITPCMFTTLCLLYRQADWATGQVAFTCASMLARRMQGQYSDRTVQEALQNLHKAGWIISQHKKGSKRNYRVDLGNFTALTGALKGQVLNPTTMRDWRDAEDVDRADGRVDGVNIAREEARDESRDETATHQSLQHPQESTIAQSPKDSLARSLVSLQTEKAGDGETPNPQDRTEPQQSCETPLDAYEVSQADDNLQRKFARGVAAQVLENLLGDTWSRFHEEKTLPKFLPSFPATLETEQQCQTKYNHMSMFIDWVDSQPKLNAKFTSVDDFFFHWLNKSGNERGLRHQFEAVYRAAQKDNPEERKHLFKAMKRVARASAPGVTNIEVDEL
jgi:hypothetical protein